jgi:hypothetical protein
MFGSRQLARGILSLAVVLTVNSEPGPVRSDDAPDLAVTLRRLARVAELYRDTALKFSCSEYFRVEKSEDFGADLRLLKRKPRGEPTFFLTHFYDDDGKLNVHRATPTSVRRARKDAVMPETQSLTADHPGIERPLFWIFLFEAGKDEVIEYDLLGRDEVFERPALKIGFKPKGRWIHDINDWVGTAWIDEETLQLLKVQGQHRSHIEARERLDRLRSEVPSFLYGEEHTIPITHTETLFEHEKNGMRFPSQVITRTNTVTLSNKNEIEHSLWLSQQFIKNCKFYNVRTSDTIRQAIFSD